MVKVEKRIEKGQSFFGNMKNLNLKHKILKQFEKYKNPEKYSKYRKLKKLLLKKILTI